MRIRVLIPGQCSKRDGSQVLSSTLTQTPRTVTNKPPKTVSELPPTSDRIEVSAESLGFTLKTDEQTLLEIDQIQEETIKAAQAIKKFALR